jgi:predicted deacylase
MSKTTAEPFELGGEVVRPGQRLRFDLPAALLPTRTQLHLPLIVVHGSRPGPRLWLSGAVHGDELNGVEIIRQVLDRISDPLPRGTLLAVPIVNVFGFIGQSRYLPDRRDLNRSFPGSPKGSLASRIAHLFLTEIVSRCTHGLDLHTASQDKSNLPQVRGNLDDPETLRCARAFGAPVMAHSSVRNGSLRAAAARRGIPVLVYEGGEPQRFNQGAIAVGVKGVLGVMRELGMIARKSASRRPPSMVVRESSWIRARKGGLLRLESNEGDLVGERQRIGTISDPFGSESLTLRAPFRGIIIGQTNNPVVHGGDAVVHLGKLDHEPEVPPQ